MLGIYLYCIRPKGSPQFFPSGLDKQHRIEFLPFEDIEAVVSRVSLEKFGSEEIRKKAKEDLQWIKAKGLAHADIVGKALVGTDGRLIPMKFGTIFKTRKALDEKLKHHHKEFTETLKGLEGKEEWGVKAYLRREPILKRLKEEDPDLVHRRKKLATFFPQGRAYFIEKEIEEYTEGKLQEAIRKYKTIFLAQLAKLALAAKENKPLEKEFTGRKEPMILNLALLLPKKNIENFKKEVRILRKKFGGQGFSFQHSGPWPPYNFV